MRSVRATIDVDAPPERVWAELTDFASFPEWNPFIRHASGELEPRSRLHIELRLFGRRTVSFDPVVTRVVPGRELRWLARMGVRGVFDTERSFAIEPRGENASRFEQSERCTGLLVPLLFPAMALERRIKTGYDAMNAAIKERAETKERVATQRLEEAPRA